MSNPTPTVSRNGLEQLGIQNPGTVHLNLPPAQLYELALRRGEAKLAKEGPLLAVTGEHTGRAPNDKFVVRDAAGEDIWWGKVNRPFEREKFNALLARAKVHVEGRELFVFEGYAGTDPSYQIKVRVINENAWQNLFARNMFVREEDPAKLVSFEPDFTVLHTPSMPALPATDGTNSSTYILLDFAQRLQHLILLVLVLSGELLGQQRIVTSAL
jgi:phosphoenolpyruvate carboxykinase (ATP)